MIYLRTHAFMSLTIVKMYTFNEIQKARVILFYKVFL